MIYVACGLIFIISIAGIIYYLRADNEAKGKAEAQNEDMRNILDDVYLAKMARERLNSDPATADSVRDQFTRKP